MNVHANIASQDDLPQTGGGILNRSLLSMLYADEWIRAGVDFKSALGKPFCKFPTSGSWRSLRVCGRRTAGLSVSYCPSCKRLAYYQPISDKFE